MVTQSPLMGLTTRNLICFKRVTPDRVPGPCRSDYKQRCTTGGLPEVGGPHVFLAGSHTLRACRLPARCFQACVCVPLDRQSSKSERVTAQLKESCPGALARPPEGWLKAGRGLAPTLLLVGRLRPGTSHVVSRGGSSRLAEREDSEVVVCRARGAPAGPAQPGS